MREDRQLHIILGILDGYSGKEPLNRFLKGYFNLHKEMGSRDRRQAADFIYNYFRIGRTLPARSREERMAVANYLCAQSVTPLLQYCLSKFLKDIAAGPQIDWLEKIDKVKSIYPDFKEEDIFPFSKHLSGNINK